ncbi:MAG: DUF4922 domain-containing protein [Paludibacter sp.]|jgi:ATP adenylyltransferase/5',5'''-P-1,P-4-tetraphosphate phosphorylase II|nr:DUF4922 domain-containing protein [Paludibacter sp.]
MKSLSQQAIELWSEQVVHWPLANRYYGSLDQVQSREFRLDTTRVLVQFNPARIASTAAKTDATSIAERPCFLCDHNRPPEQNAVDAGRYWLLVNPFPIFKQHFTIPNKEHIPQRILPVFADFLWFTRELNEFVVFYNGPRCGASAPDHLHFQAGNKGVLPLIDEYFLRSTADAELLKDISDARLLRFRKSLRKVFVIESVTSEAAMILFDELYHSFPATEGEEPMMNLLGVFESGKWIIFVLPRKAFRPSQYSAPEPQHLMISPAAIEMAGILITPVEAHFHKINAADIVDIFNQISPDEP